MSCSSVKLWKGTVVAGYGTGQIRIYEAVTGILHAEVNAHARWIYSLDIAPFSGLVSSLAEWFLTRFSNLKKDYDLVCNANGLCAAASVSGRRLSCESLAPDDDPRNQQCWGNFRTLLFFLLVIIGPRVKYATYCCFYGGHVVLIVVVFFLIPFAGGTFAQRVCDGHTDLRRQVLRWWRLCLRSDRLWPQWDNPLHTDLSSRLRYGKMFKFPVVRLCPQLNVCLDLS